MFYSMISNADHARFPRKKIARSSLAVKVSDSRSWLQTDIAPVIWAPCVEIPDSQIFIQDQKHALEAL